MTDPLDPDGEVEPTQRPRRAKSPRGDDGEDESEDVAPASPSFDPEKDFPGAVFMVPNRDWGFTSHTSEDHPGACVHYQPGQRDATLLRGTDAENVRFPWKYFFVDPAPGNGLGKRTGFELLPRFLRLHRLRLFFPERYLGRLGGETLRAMRAALARLNPEE